MLSFNSGSKLRQTFIPLHFGCFELRKSHTHTYTHTHTHTHTHTYTHTYTHTHTPGKFVSSVSPKVLIFPLLQPNDCAHSLACGQWGAHIPARLFFVSGACAGTHALLPPRTYGLRAAQLLIYMLCACSLALTENRSSRHDFYSRLYQNGLSRAFSQAFAYERARCENFTDQEVGHRQDQAAENEGAAV
jgi:hypothetical protein